jgi:hypothetical protein
MRKLTDFEALEDEVIETLRKESVMGNLEASEIILRHITRSKSGLAKWQAMQDKQPKSNQ